MEKKIKIVQIGCMHEHAPGKMDTLKKLQDIYEIVGYVDDTETASTPVFPSDQSAFQGIKKISLEEALNYPGVEAAMVEVPNNELVPMALQCLEHGLAIHMDKPAGENLALYKTLLDGYKVKNLPFQIGYMFRGNPAFQFTKRAIQNKLIGDVFWIECDMNHNYGGDVYAEYMNSFKGGIMFNLGCHLIDYVVGVMGAPEKVTPSFQTAPGTIPGSRTNCAAILEYPGCLACVRACCKDPRWERTMLAVGTKGSIAFSPQERFDGKSIELELRLTEPGDGYPAGKHKICFEPQQDRYEPQLREFADVIRGKKKSSYSVEHDYLVHSVVMAAAGYAVWDDVNPVK